MPANDVAPSARTTQAGVDEQVVEEVLTATRALIALSARSLGGLAEEVTTAQYRTLVVLASRGPQRLVDLARALEVNPSTAGRMCDRLVARKWVARRRDKTDRRLVHVTIRPAGRRVLDEVTAARRTVIIDMLAGMPPERQHALGEALATLSATAGEIPDHDWPAPPS